jgi:CMP-N-acetylneuraminic acid synthetase
LFEIDRREAQDIDEEADFEIADMMFKRLHGDAGRG